MCRRKRLRSLTHTAIPPSMPQVAASPPRRLKSAAQKRRQLRIAAPSNRRTMQPAHRARCQMSAESDINRPGRVSPPSTGGHHGHMLRLDTRPRRRRHRPTSHLPAPRIRITNQTHRSHPGARQHRYYKTKPSGLRSSRRRSRYCETKPTRPMPPARHLRYCETKPTRPPPPARRFRYYGTKPTRPTTPARHLRYCETKPFTVRRAPRTQRHPKPHKCDTQVLFPAARSAFPCGRSTVYDCSTPIESQSHPVASAQ